MSTTTDKKEAGAKGGRLTRLRRNPAPWIGGIAIALLAIYYVVVSASGALETSADVPVAGMEEPVGSDYLTLQVRVQEVNLTNREVSANILPIPHGSLVGDKAGEMSRSLRIEISSAGVTTSVVTYPGESIVDPTAVSLSLDRGDSAYPFDRPFADFQVSVEDDDTGASVPFLIDMENAARPWMLSASAGEPDSQGKKTVYPLTLDGHRDGLSITLVSFYVLAIIITTLLAVVTIGSALLQKRLEFANVIWLSATMLSFPALRAAMPGAPPIGTAMDFIVLFPCICLIAIMLVWTGGYFLWNESSILRRRDLEETVAVDAMAKGNSAEVPTLTE
ncbi:DUF4436 domain-containing protein [Microbacterium resistens]|uniref:DUF4436 family protein n=1 Tax=Microbacterium resistens TaxID=156977 RepID=UPI00082C896E|nr:DUF4436 family protein [Microbacterium resistens]MBW1641170.1 DUF4436 domain-containing protein [Microbacterium resistens]